MTDADMSDEQMIVTDEDRDPANVMVRAGYMFGLAMKQPKGEDRTFLVRAARSLLTYGAAQARIAELEAALRMIRDDPNCDIGEAHDLAARALDAAEEKPMPTQESTAWGSAYRRVGITDDPGPTTRT